jgi:beta-lactamase regulating signal transducer with metallopeptidase domain
MEMTALSLIFNVAADRASEMAVAALWQGVLIAGILAVVLHFVPRISAGYRFAVWTAAFVALICLSLFSLMPASSAGAAHAMEARAIASKPWLVFDVRWSLAIAGLWLAATLFRAADLAVHSVRLRRLWKDAEPIQLDERGKALLAGATAECGRGPIEVCTTTTLQRPSVIGFFRPRILIPDWLFARLTQGEFEQIVLHEAEHLSRRDDWTNLVQKLCLVLFPLNPALMWIERRLCREREMACDEGVVRVTRAPRAYAACLASMAERGLERRVEALSLGAWQRRPELVHRVHSILRSKSRLSPAGARVLLGTLGCGLLAGSVQLARSPQLVAFVPERKVVAATEAKNQAKIEAEIPVQIASAEPVNVGFRDARTVLPRPPSSNSESPKSELPVAMNTTLRQPSEAGATASKAVASPMQVLANATRHDAMNGATIGATNGPANGLDQQWIVLTQWEQVDTASDIAGDLKSDYDTDAGNTPASRDQQLGSRITVTQLIFRVSPSDTGSKSATKSKANHSTSQPGFATFRDGWLVIQL